MKTLIGLLAVTTLAFGQTVNPQRFSATEIHYTKAGAVAELRGNVVIKTQSAIIHAESADLEISHWVITVHGDSRWDFLPVQSKPGLQCRLLDQPEARQRSRPAERLRKPVMKGEVTHLHGKCGDADAWNRRKRRRRGLHTVNRDGGHPRGLAPGRHKSAHCAERQSRTALDLPLKSHANLFHSDAGMGAGETASFEPEVFRLREKNSIVPPE